MKLSAVEYCVLSDMRQVIDRFANNNFLVYQSDDSNSLSYQSDGSDSLAYQSDGSDFLWPLFEDYSENDFDKFFTRLGSKRSKELINLFFKLKMRVSNSVFETEVFFLYMCIKDAYLINLFYFDDDEHNCFDCVMRTFDQQFKSIVKSLKLKLEDFGVFV
ncbi:P52 family lipoprotein [Borreliella bavariensis]|uniref:P52 family lipoprotein n=1 Tax=Borreliella bavariensis TaxID=664662 RepID=UPI001F1FB4C8|nr:P52 family lipoprotein [Borreliella bavariensis]